MIPPNPLGPFLKAAIAATGIIAVEVAMVTMIYFLIVGGDVAVSRVELVLGVFGMAITAALWSIIPAFVVTFTIIATVGLPTLWFLERASKAERSLFVAAGAAYGTSAGAVLGSLLGAGAASAAMLLVPGAAAGWVIWTKTRSAAVRRPRPSPAPPS